MDIGRDENRGYLLFGGKEKERKRKGERERGRDMLREKEKSEDESMSGRAYSLLLFVHGLIKLFCSGLR